jgi:hypothetical protein
LNLLRIFIPPDSSSEEIDKFRRKAQRTNQRSLLFMDETHVTSNAIPLHSLGLPQQKAHIQVHRERFGIRIDLIDSGAVDALGPYRIITASERHALGTKGIRKEMFLDLFEVMMIPFAKLRGEAKTIFVVDRSRVHDLQRMFELAEDLMPESLVKVWDMPTNSAKFLSPLDNGFHSELQSSFAKLIINTDRSENSAAECLQSFMHHYDPSNLRSYYRNCGLVWSSGRVSKL